MQSYSPERFALPDLCRTLTANGNQEAIETAACLDSVVIRRLSATVGSGPILWALEEAARILPRIEEDFADVSELPRREIGANLEAWVLDIVALLADVDGGAMSQQTIPQVARGAARLDVSFERLTRSIRMVQSEYTSRFFLALSNNNLQPEEYTRLVSAISRITDDGLEQLIVHYLDERANLLDSQMVRRRELVKELLAGTEQPSQAMVTQIANDLGLTIHQVHTGFVVVHQAHTAMLEQKTIHRDLRAKLRNVEMLIQTDGYTQTAFWITTPVKPGPAILEPVLQTLAEFPRAICTMGEPAQGSQGFRQTHLQARDLASIAPQLASSPVLRWSDHTLTVTLGTHAERAQWFVRSVLGPLADTTEKAHEQRTTLQAYLSSGQSLLQAATQCNVHRNTIVYRLQQIESRLDRPIRDQALQLQCALHLIAQLGDQMLSPK